MNHLRKQILFLCDSLILIIFSTFFSWFSLRYDLTDAVGQCVQLIQNFALLYACTVLFQLLFRTYDSLWRYAESKEYLSLLMAAFCGFFLYEVLSRIFLQSIISFMLLTCVASLWVLGMLLLRFTYRVYRSRVLFSKGSHQILWPLSVQEQLAFSCWMSSRAIQTADTVCNAFLMTTLASWENESMAWK